MKKAMTIFLLLLLYRNAMALNLTVMHQIDNKDQYINWMYKNSRMPKQILENIYKKVQYHPYKDILLAIMKVESKFNPLAVSRKGAIGLMQIRIKVWAEELKKQGIIQNYRELYLIDVNIKAGFYIFMKYLKKTKDLNLALKKYCGGSDTYARKVLQALGEIYLLKQS